MKTYKEFTSNEPEPLDEGITANGIFVERKLKAALNAVKATDDTNEKLDLIIKALHYALGSIALNTTTNNKRRR